MNALPPILRAVLPNIGGLLFSIFLLSPAPRAEAAIVFYPNLDADSLPFEEAVEEADLMMLGEETFSQIELDQWAVIPNFILSPGVPAGPLFPTGTSEQLGVVIHTNADGASPAAPNPGGALFAYRSLAVGGKAWVGPDRSKDGLDIILDPPGYRGRVQGFAFDVATGNEADVMVKLFDNTNSIVAEHTYTISGQDRIAIVSSGQSIFRVNVFNPTGFLDVSRLSVYVAPIPEPAALSGLLGLVALGVVIRRRSRRS